MTTFNIISIGDVEFLGRILNAVATVCGTGDFKTLCICGFIFGLLFIGFQCIFQGAQRINLQHTLVCFICYMCFFGPSCTVTIEDARGSTYTRVVDNVPIGVGVAGMAISGIGYGVTKLMEQAFGTVDRTENYSYIEPLKILNDLRAAAYSDDIWAAIDNQCGAGCDTRQAVVNYLAECTSKGIQVGVINRSNLRQADFTGNADAFQFVNNAYMTYLPLIESGKLVGTDNDGYVTCAEGWSKVKTHVLNKIPTAAVATRLNGMLNIKEFSEDGTSKAVSTDWSKISDSFQMLGLTANRAQDFMKAAVVDSVMNEANAQFLKSQHDVSTAIMINQAIVQRDTQWASEQSMFVSASRGFMAFFEGFVYAVTPLMGFFFMVGAFGLSLVGKYFMVLAWIQLWLPCMSICNLYTMTGARSAMSVANNYGASIYALDTIYNNVSHWVAVGGMLFAATPVLALFMISGSMYAFTTLTNRMQGRDHFNEKGIAPDVQQVGAVNVAQPAHTYNRYQGGLASGAQEIMPSAQIMSNVANAEVGAKAKLDAETEAFSANFVKAGGLTHGFSESNAVSQSVAQEVGAIKVNGNSTVKDVVDRTLQSSNYTAEQKNAVTGQVAMAVSTAARMGDAEGRGFLERLSAKGGPVGMVLGALGFEAKAGLDGKSTNTDEAGSGSSYAEGHSNGEGASRTDSLMSQIARATKAGLSNVSADQWNHAASHTDNRQLADSYSKMGSSVQSYTEAKTVADAIGVGAGGRSWNYIAERFQHSEEGRQEFERLQHFDRDNSLVGKDAQTYQKDVTEFAKTLTNGDLVTPYAIRKGKVMAALNFMANHRQYGDLAQSMDKASLPSTRASMMDLSGPDKVSGASGQTAARRAQAAAETRGIKSTIDLAGETPKASYEAGVAAAEKKREDDKAEVKLQGGRDAAAVTADHKRALLETLQKDHGEGIGIWIGKNMLSDAAPLSLLRKFVDDKSPAQEGTPGTFGQFITNHKQQLTGLSAGELNYLNHYYDFKHQVGFDKDDDKEMSGTAKRLATAREQLKEEIKDHVFGESYNPEKHEATLNKYVDGMTFQLEKLESNEAQGYSTKVQDFNRTFHVKAAPTQKIS